MIFQSHATVAFGSCNRQNRPQSHWPLIQSFDPSLFLWLGDAVYPKKGKSIEGLRFAFQNLTDNSLYHSFISNTSIDGIWDDHDYGINDAGRNVPDREYRQEEFIKFMQQGRAKEDAWNSLRKQDGLYHSYDTNLAGLRTKFIFLDTRSHRDRHFIPSLGEYGFKGSALIASALRAAYTLLGMGRKYKGEVLGEAQWKWLQSELESSSADAHIIVSSIQVCLTQLSRSITQLFLCRYL